MAQKKLPTAVRKEQIVETALKILSDNNIKKLKVADIAKHMNLAPSVLYRHFKDRNAILSTILEHFRGNFYKNLEKIKKS